MRAVIKKLNFMTKAKALDIWPTANCKNDGNENLEARMKILRTVALIKQKKSNNSEAGDIYQALLFVKIKVFGASHPDTLTSISDLGFLFINIYDYNNAERLHRNALNIRERVLGLNHKNTLSSVSSLADVLKLQGRYGMAESFYRRASIGRE